MSTSGGISHHRDTENTEEERRREIRDIRI
jgi:hypothetical protein